MSFRCFSDRISHSLSCLDYRSLSPKQSRVSRFGRNMLTQVNKRILPEERQWNDFSQTERHKMFNAHLIIKSFVGGLVYARCILCIWDKYSWEFKAENNDQINQRRNPNKVIFSLGGQLEKLMDDLHNELSSNPPLPGSYTARKEDLCAALFVDNNWYVINMAAYSINGEETYFLMC